VNENRENSQVPNIANLADYLLLWQYSVKRYLGILELEASPVDGQQLQEKDKKKRKRKGEKN